MHYSTETNIFSFIVDVNWRPIIFIFSDSGWLFWLNSTDKNVLYHHLKTME